MIFRFFAETKGWPPSVVGKLSLGQLEMYLRESSKAARGLTRKLLSFRSPAEAAVHFAAKGIK